MKKTIGLAMFWIGTIYIFGASWLAMWWIAPVWKKTPIEEFEGSAWAFEGPIYSLIGLSLPIGIILAAIGLMISSKEKQHTAWQFYTFVGVILFASFSTPTASSNRPKISAAFHFFILYRIDLAVGKKEKDIEWKGWNHSRFETHELCILLFGRQFFLYIAGESHLWIIFS